ncbi:MAG: hypothetical protein KC619_31420 [Myxococcales bacterium]|nr:hypothetical protein [Myxococcales bacterium]
MAGTTLLVGGAVLVLAGVIWRVALGAATRRHPSWAPHRRAERAARRLRDEERERDRRRHPGRHRHPRRSPWY